MKTYYIIILNTYLNKINNNYFLAPTLKSELDPEPKKNIRILNNNYYNKY